MSVEQNGPAAAGDPYHRVLSSQGVVGTSEGHETPPPETRSEVPATAPPPPQQRQTSSIGDDWGCVVCMDRDRAVRFEPCGHCVTCGVCAGRLTACPVCRRRIGRSVHQPGAAAAEFTARQSTYTPAAHELCASCRTERRCLVGAAAAGHVGCVRALLDVSDPLATDRRGRTAVYAAAEGGHDGALLALLEVEEFVPTVNKVCGRELRMRPMHAAAFNAHTPTLQILYDHGAAIGTQDAYGATPIILAARVDAVEAVKKLLHLRASTVHRDHDGRTALFKPRRRQAPCDVKSGDLAIASDHSGQPQRHAAARRGVVPAGLGPHKKMYRAL